MSHSSQAAAPAAAPAASGAVPRRWTALVFIALAQLMVVLDATIVNIAMPSAQKALDISNGDRQWIITAYTLAFGGLLLFGGRIADLVGRKRTFLIGLIGFAAASAVGGAAANAPMLFGARAAQGAFGALLAPSALSLLSVMFTEGRERAKAFGVYGAIAGGGAGLGLIMGGVLTEYLDWRWALYVNVPIAVVAFLGAAAFIHVSAVKRNRSKLDVSGALLVTAGLVALVYGFTRAESDGWTDRWTLGLFGATVVLLLLFVLVEAKVRAPLMPLRVVGDRNRGGAYLAVGLGMIAMFGLFLFLTYYMQVVKGYTPLKTGVSFLPMVAGMMIGSTQISARLMNRVPPRALMVPGLLVAAVGMGMLTQMQVDSDYLKLVLPAQFLLGLGLGTNMMPAMNLATMDVRPQDSGVASAMVNTSQQVGGSIGTALLNTIAATATTSYITDHMTGPRPDKGLLNAGMVHGYTQAIWVSTAVLVFAALLVLVLVNHRAPGKQRKPAPAEGPAEGPAETAAAPVAQEAPVELAKRNGERPAPSWAVASPDGAPSDAVCATSFDGPGTPVHGAVRGAEGVPVGHASLTLIDVSGHQLSRTLAGADGAYELAAPGPGSYVLIAAADGHEPLAGTVVVGDGALAHDVLLSDTCSLALTVRSAADGAPVAGAMAVLTDVRGEVLTSGKTGEDGVCSLDGLAAGTFTLAVSAQGHRPTALPVELGARGTHRQEILLSAGVRVQGTIRAGADGRPLPDARVTVTDAAGNVVRTATTGSDGAYAFSDLDAGDYTLTASGYPPFATALSVNGSDEAGVDVLLGHPEDA